MVSGKIAQALEQSIGRELDKSVDKDVVQVGFKRLTEDAVIPTKAHASDSGYDLVASEDVILEPGETAVVPTGIAVQLPKGFEATVRPRSGVTSRTKLRVSYGTVDFGYSGEVGIIVDNISQISSLKLRELFIDDKTHSSFDDISYKIRKGDKLAQLVIQRLPDVEAVEVFDVRESERGGRGFGSSGVVAGERDKYSSEICGGCSGHGYVRFRNGGDEECSDCDGEGMIYEERAIK